MTKPICLVDVCETTDVLGRLPETYSAWLSESELARLPTLRVESRRNHYLAGHWLARELLSQAFGKTPNEWLLLERKSQAPQIVSDDDSLRLSISHSGDYIAAAVANHPIGIDIEQRPRVLDKSIEPLLLNPDEIPGSLSQDELLMRWVAKEAWIKMRGESALPGGLKRLHLRVATGEEVDVTVHPFATYYAGLTTHGEVAAQWRNGTNVAVRESTQCLRLLVERLPDPGDVLA